MKELTTTPFMTQIVTEILPRLKLQRSGERGIKSLLVLELGESLSDITWAFLNDKNDKPSSIAVLEAGQKVEVKLDDGSVPSASIEMLDGNGTYEVKFENGGSEKGVAKDRIVKAASIMSNLQTIQKAIDAGKVEGWTTQINAAAKRVSMKVKEMADKEEEWMSNCVDAGKGDWFGKVNERE